VKFIDEHRYDTIHGRAFGVEPICRVLSEHGCLIAPSTYYEAMSRPVCDRVIREAELLTQIRRVHVDNYGCMGPRFRRIRPLPQLSDIAAVPGCAMSQMAGMGRRFRALPAVVSP
jgi:hypothetical protein